MTITNLIEMFLLPMLVVLIPVVIGRRYGIYRRKKSELGESAPLGAVIAAAFGLLAFMLGFTFQIASDRYDRRKELLLEEVSNIRTTYLRAGLIPEPFQSGSKRLLVKYVQLRTDLASSPSALQLALSHSQKILDTCWQYAESLAALDRSSEVYALYTSSVNDIISNHNQRITMALQYRIPANVLWVLFIISFVSMFMLGFHFGITGGGSFWLNLLLAFIFAAVMLLIFALDRPETGLVKIDQIPMESLRDQLNKE